MLVRSSGGRFCWTAAWIWLSLTWCPLRLKFDIWKPSAVMFSSGLSTRFYFSKIWNCLFWEKLFVDPMMKAAQSQWEMRKAPRRKAPMRKGPRKKGPRKKVTMKNGRLSEPLQLLQFNNIKVLILGLQHMQQCCEDYSTCNSAALIIKLILELQHLKQNCKTVLNVLF